MTARVLVTGGTGLLGAALVPCLVGRGHEVTILSRRPAAAPAPGATYRRGDVVTGEAVSEAMQGAQAVVHAATSVGRHTRAKEVTGTERMLAAAQRAGADFVYVSIVGVDRHPFAYYRAKLAAERLVEGAAGGWTIQRATQFHELMDRFLGLPAVPATPHLAFQPVAAADVAERLADLLAAGPTGRAEDFGGPEVLGIRQLADARRRLTSRRSRILPVPAVGFLRAFDRGAHLCPDHRSGTRTWEEWLASRRAA